MSKEEDTHILSDEVIQAIEKLNKARKGAALGISISILSKLPPNVVKTVLKLKRDVKRMDTRVRAARKIKAVTPSKRKMVRIDDILEIDPDETLKASLTPEEVQQLIYKKRNRDDDE